MAVSMSMTAFAGQAAASGPALESRAEGRGEEKQTKTGETALAEYLPEGLT